MALRGGVLRGLVTRGTRTRCLLAVGAAAAGVDVSYTRWPRMWHDFVLQPGLVAAADSALAEAAWFLTQVKLAA